MLSQSRVLCVSILCVFALVSSVLMYIPRTNYVLSVSVVAVVMIYAGEYHSIMYAGNYNRSLLVTRRIFGFITYVFFHSFRPQRKLIPNYCCNYSSQSLSGFFNHIITRAPLQHELVHPLVRPLASTKVLHHRVPRPGLVPPILPAAVILRTIRRCLGNASVVDQHSQLR